MLETILFNNYERFEQLIKYWNKNQENVILDKINYINFVVGTDLNGNEITQLNKINTIYFNNDNRCLIQILKNVKNVNQVLIQEKDLFEKNIEFFTNKNVFSIVLFHYHLNQSQQHNLYNLFYPK